MNPDNIKLKDLVWIVISAPWFIGGFVGVLILSRQFLVLVRRGEWAPFSGIDLLRLGFDAGWLYAPTDWIGIYKLVEWLHGGLFALIVGGFISFVLVVCLAQLLEKRQ